MKKENSYLEVVVKSHFCITGHFVSSEGKSVLFTSLGVIVVQNHARIVHHSWFPVRVACFVLWFVLATLVEPHLLKGVFWKVFALRAGEMVLDPVNWATTLYKNNNVFKLVTFLISG